MPSFTIGNSRESDPQPSVSPSRHVQPARVGGGRTVANVLLVLFLAGLVAPGGAAAPGPQAADRQTLRGTLDLVIEDHVGRGPTMAYPPSRRRYRPHGGTRVRSRPARPAPHRPAGDRDGTQRGEPEAVGGHATHRRFHGRSGNSPGRRHAHGTARGGPDGGLRRRQGVAPLHAPAARERLVHGHAIGGRALSHGVVRPARLRSRRRRQRRARRVRPVRNGLSAAANCNYYDWAYAAEAAAQAAGIDFSKYQHRVFVLPHYSSLPACTWAGVANVGCGTFCRAWIAEAESPMVTAHELGHNLNMAHAGTDPENDGTINAAYGDSSNPMGSSRAWHLFNGAHANQLGWFRPTPRQRGDRDQQRDVRRAGRRHRPRRRRPGRTC